MNIVTPYLIQRCKIETSVESGVRFSHNVKLDYMGSAEFEFGIVPKSLRIMAESKDYHLVPVRDIINDNGDSLYVWCAIPFEKVPEYVEILKRLRYKNDIRLKEVSHFYINKTDAWYSKDNPRTDFWWDLDNNVMFTFNVEMMKVLPGCLAASLEYMNEVKSGMSA